MKKLTAILLLVTVALASSAEPIVSVDYFNTLRIPNSHVQISVDSDGVLAVTTESRGEDKVIREVRLSAKELKDLRRDLEDLNWDKISTDKIKGLDGTSIRISHGKKSVLLWSPNHNTKKRGLDSIQKTIETIFDLSELDKTGRIKQK